MRKVSSWWNVDYTDVISYEDWRVWLVSIRIPKVGIPTRWVKSVPSKVNITAWKIKTNALPTRFNLSRRGMDIDTLMCPVCKGGVETISHLFFQCVLSKQIMRKVSSWWNVDYTDVSSYEDWRVWLVSIRITNKLKSMMEGVFYGSVQRQLSDQLQSMQAQPQTIITLLPGPSQQPPTRQDAPPPGFHQPPQPKMKLSTWNAFTSAVELPFGAASYDNHEAALFKLKQTSSVTEYLRIFAIACPA
nr:RNA-directed DNA polymerase, eukaryota [Tanacetum cinerariifolium]